MEKKEVTKRFWKIVRGRFWKNLREDVEMKSSIRNLVFSSLWAFLFTVLYISKKIQISFFDNVIFNLIFEIVLIGGPLIYSFLSLLYTTFSEIPAKMYDELGGFVEKPYDLSPEPHPDKVVRDDYTRAINVKTITPFDLIGCRLELLEAKDINSGKDILRRREFLSWSDREGAFKGHEPKTIQGNGESRLCNVAWWQGVNQRAWFTFAYSSSLQVPSGTYLLTIQVTGKWQDHNIKEKEQFYLKYQNNTIQLGSKLDKLDNDIIEVIVESEKQKEEGKELQSKKQSQSKKALTKTTKK